MDIQEGLGFIGVGALDVGEEFGGEFDIDAALHGSGITGPEGPAEGGKIRVVEGGGADGDFIVGGAAEVIFAAHANQELAGADANGGQGDGEGEEGVHGHLVEGAGFGAVGQCGHELEAGAEEGDGVRGGGEVVIDAGLDEQLVFTAAGAGVGDGGGGERGEIVFGGVGMAGGEAEEAAAAGDGADEVGLVVGVEVVLGGEEGAFGGLLLAFGGAKGGEVEEGAGVVGAEGDDFVPGGTGFFVLDGLEVGEVGKEDAVGGVGGGAGLEDIAGGFGIAIDEGGDGLAILAVRVGGEEAGGVGEVLAGAGGEF